MQKSQGPDEVLLLPGEAAQRLGVTTTTLAAWANAGTVRAIVLPSGHRRYRVEDIDALAAKRAS